MINNELLYEIGWFAEYGCKLEIHHKVRCGHK